MPNDPVTLNQGDQRAHLLLTLYTQLHGIGILLVAIGGKAADPTYNQGQVDHLVIEQDALRARIGQIKNGAPFAFPTSDQVRELGVACDALAKIDLTTASAIAIIGAANAIVAALPIAATKP